MKFTVKNKRHVRFEDGQQVTYQVGDIIEANEAEALAFRDKFEPVVEVTAGPAEKPVKKATAPKGKPVIEPVVDAAVEAVVTKEEA